MKKCFIVMIVLPHGGSTISEYGTLKEAKWRLASQLTYYQTGDLYPADHLDYELTEVCVVCYGDGKVQKVFKRPSDQAKHRYNPVYLRCPECGGKNSSRVIIPLNEKEAESHE